MVARPWRVRQTLNRFGMVSEFAVRSPMGVRSKRSAFWPAVGAPA